MNTMRVTRVAVTAIHAILKKYSEKAKFAPQESLVLVLR